jgi:hypothetical protein
MIVRLHGSGAMMPKGGRRDNAGRKPASEAGASVVFSARIPPDLAAVVEAFLARSGVKKSEILAVALRAYLDSRQGGADTT